MRVQVSETTTVTPAGGTSIRIGDTGEFVTTPLTLAANTNQDIYFSGAGSFIIPRRKLVTYLYISSLGSSVIEGDITGMELTLLYLNDIGSSLTYGTNPLNITNNDGIQLLGDTVFSANEYIQLFADAATCVTDGKWTASTKVMTISGGENPGWSNVEGYYDTIVNGGVTVTVPLAWESGDDAFPELRDVLALEYDLTQITEPTTIELAIKADSSWFDAGQEASIDWGDGTTPDVVSATSGQSGYISHEYADAGTYIVKVSGTMKAYRRAVAEAIAGQDLLTHIRSFGILGIESFRYAFINCTGLISVPKYLPKSISNMYCMFNDCSGAAFNPDVSNWDVSNVTNMYYMFRYCSGNAFNPNVSNWDVSNVTNMYCMFAYCSGAAFRGGRGTAGTGIANWTPDSLTNAVSFMASSKKQEDGFLDTILTAWAALIGDTEHPLPEDITIHFGTNKYTAAASDAISALENHGWVISSGGLAE
ncbi:MAG: hypothetical protein BWY95_02424 [Bacteroidetes bacterium ADurb.BinA104]|nr:MAG: hypothetical protein BWY95_02424 [Bacteroidetes bacterium ADurb.BinA104]